MAWLAARLEPDRQVLLWDRPNGSGGSRVVLCSEASEAEMHADSLESLLTALRLPRVILFGSSNGGRMSAFFAAKYPHRAAGVVFQTTTGGGYAASTLAAAYYRPYAAAARAGGMAAFMATSHYRLLCSGGGGGGDDGGVAAENAAALAGAEAGAVASQFERWAQYMEARGDPLALFPMAGVDAATLRRVRCPSLCLHSSEFGDGMHTLEAMEALAGALSAPLVHELDLGKWLPAVRAFMDGLDDGGTGEADAPSS